MLFRILAAMLTIACAQDSDVVISSNQFMETTIPTAPENTTITKKMSARIGLRAIAKRLSLPIDRFRIRSFQRDSANVTHVYVDLLSGGVVVRGQETSAHVKNGQVIALTGRGDFIASALTQTPTKFSSIITEGEAAEVASRKFNFTLKAGNSSLVLMPRKNGNLVWVYEVELKKGLSVVKIVTVHATTKAVIATNHLAKSYSYKAIKLPKDTAANFVKIVNPELNASSPNGWSSEGVTSGNNANALILKTGYRLKSRKGLFSGKYNQSQEPSTIGNVNAALANAFYVVNLMHDVSYQYGFNEQAGNFQKSNLLKGAKSRDALVVSVQDPEAMNNAFFQQESDGVPPKLILGTFSVTSPRRDSALDNGVIIHEYTHGITGRLTGGRNTVMCLMSSAADCKNF